MYNGDPGENNPDRNSAVGSNKAFITKLLSSTTLPSCLATCDGNGHVESDVAADHCYIDRYCFAHGEHSPYVGTECFKCDATVSKIAWTAAPLGDTHCKIGGTCYAAGDKKSG